MGSGAQMVSRIDLSFGHGPSNMLEMKFRMRYHLLAELICV